MHFDEIDLKIASILGPNSRSSNREIARRLGINETTVRRRLSQMIESGILSVPAVIDIEKLPDKFMAIVGIRHQVPIPDDTFLQKVNELDSVIYSMTVTGHFDMFAIILAVSRKKLLEALRQIQSIEEVIDTQTYVILENYGLDVQADKLLRLLENNK
ncbi:MAG TPA: winged helix-turn-helix transcriptional regulator [bacterium]|nr:winged helix-turn-helix transcriptional regulator [bacterium]